MRRQCVILSAGLCAALASIGDAASQSIIENLDVFGQAQLRLELADQDGFPEDSTALTLRLRPGVEFRVTPKLTVLFEAEAVVGIVRDFNDTSGNFTDRPVIADPDSFEVNRLQLQYNFDPETFVTLGRQQIRVDDQRFIGQAPFRQNDQTYDAVHFSTGAFGSATVQAGYIDQVNRVLGGDSPIGTYEGASYYVNVNVPTPIGRVGAFHYALDLGTPTPTALDNQFSSRTSGVRIDGRWHYELIGIDWEASYARQIDFSDNPNDYAADYWLIGANFLLERASLGLRYEILGDGGSQSFQTPLAALHKFNGAADIFLITPEGGFSDLDASAAWNFGDVGPFEAVKTTFNYHTYASDRTGVQLGDEINAGVTARLGPFNVAATWADYRANTFAVDTKRFFLSLQYLF